MEGYVPPYHYMGRYCCIVEGSRRSTRFTLYPLEYVGCNQFCIGEGRRRSPDFNPPAHIFTPRKSVDGRKRMHYSSTNQVLVCTQPTAVESSWPSNYPTACLLARLQLHDHSPLYRVYIALQQLTVCWGQQRPQRGKPYRQRQGMIVKRSLPPPPREHETKATALLHCEK